jgi:hypothetical protein
MIEGLRFKAECRKLQVGIMQTLLIGGAIRDRLSLDEQEVIAQKYFPKRDERDTVPPEEDYAAMELTLKVTPDQVRHQMDNLDTDTSAATTGMTSTLLKKMSQDPQRNANAPPATIYVALASYANKILSGTICQGGRRLIVGARRHLAPKPEVGERSIVIECAIKRVFGTVAKKAVCPKVGPTIAHLQLGADVPTAGEIMTRMLNNALDHEDSVIQLDSSNAYGNVRIQQMFSAIMKRASSLVRFAMWKYGQDVEIRNSVGKIIAVRQTGFGQGDSLAGLLYDLSSFDQVEELSTALKEEDGRYNSDTYNVKTREPGFVVPTTMTPMLQVIHKSSINLQRDTRWL